MTRVIALTLTVLAGAACESPTGPSDLSGVAVGAGAGAGVAAVAGTYRGPVTLTIPNAPGEPPMRDTGQLTVSVTQDGPTVTLTGTVDWPWTGGHETIWRDVVGTLNAIGTWTGPPAQNHTDPDCGYVTYRHTRIAFRLDTMTYDMMADTEWCGRFEYSATLTRS